MEEFQKGRESGKLDYNMPVFNAKEKLRKGLIKEEDIPYMQRRGGRPDNKDTKSGKDPMKCVATQIVPTHFTGSTLALLPLLSVRLRASFLPLLFSPQPLNLTPPPPLPPPPPCAASQDEGPRPGAVPRQGRRRD